MLRKKVFFTIAFFVILIGGVVAYVLLMNFNDYSVQESLRTENAGKTSYQVAFGGLLSYNPDGVSLLDLYGNQKWNVSFEMQTPIVEKNENYAVVYDRQGSIIEIVDKNGEVGRINTSYPITATSLADNGHVSVIMQQQEVAKIVTFDAAGNILAQGELHGGESGYPLALSLSSDGKVLAVSVLHLSEADVKTQILFYDFSDEGKKRENNKSTTFSYSDEIIPVLDHVNNDKIIAVGTKSIMVFSDGAEPKVLEEKFYENPIKSVVHNDRYFGVISEQELEGGEITNLMEMFSLSAGKRFTKHIDTSYSKCELLENDEILLTDGKNTTIYTKHGIEKFSYTFDADIQNMIPAKGLRNYYLLQNGELSKIHLN